MGVYCLFENKPISIRRYFELSPQLSIYDIAYPELG